MSNPNASCLNCPSLLPANNSDFFKKSIGVPVCARYGKPIGRITSSEKEKESIARHLASNCDSYGKPKPATPDWSEAKFQVMLPDPEVIGKPRAAPEMVTSCAGCKFFVNEAAVAKDLGWTTGLCSAKGKLLLGHRYSLEARACEERDFGTVRNDTTGLMYLPEYEDNFVGHADPIREFKKQQKNWVDPSEYETDKPVTEDEHDSGVRAWRKVSDPLTGNDVFLPIFRRDFFTSEQAALIPATGDDEHPEDYVDHNFYTYKVGVLWMELDETPAFWGKAGTGKTEFYRHMAWLMQVPFHRFSITPATELDDLAGKMHYTEGVGTHFKKGRFIEAWESTCVIVVDEWNAGQPDVQQFLRPAFDNSKLIVLDQADGELSKRNIDCYVGVAMNPAWDPLNVGTNVLGDADANRLMHLSIQLPPEELEREIIRKRCEHDGYEIPESMVNTIMAIASDVRALTDNNTLPISWAIRPQIKVARASRWFDLLTAYRMASADYLDPAEQAMLLDVVKSHVEF